MRAETHRGGIKYKNKDKLPNLLIKLSVFPSGRKCIIIIRIGVIWTSKGRLSRTGKGKENNLCATALLQVFMLNGWKLNNCKPALRFLY